MGAPDETTSCHSVEADRKDGGIDDRPGENGDDTQEVFWTPEEEAKLVRKIDWYLLPAIWLMYLLSYMDRTNIGNAKIAGMADDLDLTSNQYSVILVVFFIGYVLFEPGSNMILVRSRPSIYLPAIMAVWGCLTCVMAAVKHYHHLIILRVIIGIMEAGFAPGILLIFSSWYKRTEQSKRFAVFMSAAILSGAFGGLLAGAITGGLEGAHGLRGWRWLFIVEGAATVGWAGVSVFLLLDFPASSKKLTERERAIAVARLRMDSVVQRGDDEKLGKRQSFMRALKDWRTWGFILGYMVIVGSSTLSYFYPTLVRGLGYTRTVQAQYMTVPIYVVAFVCTAISGYFADKIPAYRGLVIACWLAFSMVTSIIVCCVYNFTARYVLLVLMAAGLWASNAVSLSFASSTFGSMDAEVRGIALALMNAMGNLAQIYGAYLFPSEDEPNSPTTSTVRNGEAVIVPTVTVPADIRLMEAINFETDEASLTRESLLVRKARHIRHLPCTTVLGASHSRNGGR
ncbi:related to allantoate permease [Cephalotrichum gorgonifer]|uniref:Related to allantoate permease n=1 Tax=Cephalotrichum gorgonifer TaxID=2041049 RepID=A0AAE8N447_9PEZI|nr:related to allantoate permease [Cephalotrichum gorgonifer]